MKRCNAQELPTTVVGLSLVLAPLFGLASSLVAPALRNDDARAQLDVISQHPNRWYWFTLLLLVGSILLVPALLGIAALVRERAPRLGNLGGGLAVLGFLIAIGDVMTLLLEWQMAAEGANRREMVALLERFDEATGAGIVFGVGGLTALIGTVLLSVGLIRGRVAPTWAAIGLSVAIVLNIGGFTASSNVVVTISWAALLVAMGCIGRIVLAGGRRARIADHLPQAQPAAEVR